MRLVLVYLATRSAREYIGTVDSRGKPGGTVFVQDISMQSLGRIYRSSYAAAKARLTAELQSLV